MIGERGRGFLFSLSSINYHLDAGSSFSGLGHLPVTQEIGGSNPLDPAITTKQE